MNNQTKRQLNSFFHFNDDPKNIGLAIAESKESVPNMDFWRDLDNNILYHVIDSPKSADELKEKIAQVQKKGRRIVIDIKVDPYPTVVSLLKEISQFGEFNVKNAEGYTIETIAVMPGSIMVVAERNFIKKKITYPNFYNIFDSAFSLK